MSDMYIMDQTGHSTITWDPTKPVEVDVARDAFDKLIKERYQAFRVEASERQGSKMTSFDPQAGKIMMVPQLVGG